MRELFRSAGNRTAGGFQRVSEALRGFGPSFPAVSVNGATRRIRDAHALGWDRRHLSRSRCYGARTVGGIRGL